MSAVIETERLLLLPASVAIFRAELAGVAALARAADADVAPDWPPEHFDADAVAYILALAEREGDDTTWGVRYFALKREGARPLLIGTGGFKGAPRNGRVEIGYSVTPAHYRRGYASEAAAAMASFAFARSDVDHVIAHTLPHLVGSIGVLEKCGFRLGGPGEEEGAVMYVLRRADWMRLEPRP